MSDSDEDAREQVRLIKHQELRQAVLAGDERTVCVLLEALAGECQVIVNMVPSGANSLLFLSTQSGQENITKRLLHAGADGRLHAVTKYSPLYAAVHNGHYNVAKLILEQSPDLVQQTTVERWLPIHAACINGHLNLVELLLNHKYPEHLYSTYRDEEGVWEWRLPFDVNQQDVTGQTSLYIASILGNKALVKALLNWKVICHKTVELESAQTTPVTPTRKRISFGIQAIMSKLNISAEGENVQEAKDCEKCPINVNLRCGAVRETALMAAVRGGFMDVATILLQHGADPNIIAKPVEDQNDPKCSEEIYGLSNVPLAEACKQRCLPMVELLLKYGARDEHSTALSIAATAADDAMLNLLLARRVHPDSDYKINRRSLPSPVDVKVFSPSSNNISYSTMFPNVPTIIDWHNQNNVQLSSLQVDWMVNGVLQLNPKLRDHPRVKEVALTAITRIDLSHNNLQSLPLEIFNLASLKYLNIAQNKIVELPKAEPTSNGIKTVYNCPVLEELFLQDNRLVILPADVFRLPALIILDVSNNKLQELPFDMWKAPKLRELNIAFNLLKDLPVPPMQTSASQLSLDKLELEPFSNMDTNEAQKTKAHNLSLYQLVHRNTWGSQLEITDNELKWNESKQEEGVSQLNSLNIANNLFNSIPAALPCLAVNLTRLNMSYNSLRSMGHVTSYPSTLKQLDLSHNEISCWPSLPRIAESDPHLLCYSFVERSHLDSQTGAYEQASFSRSNSNSKSSSFRSTVLKSVCRHRRHLRLESLRTLILADNLLTRIQLSTDDITTFSESEDSEWSVVGITKSRLIFPNLSMLDISNNCLKEIPPSLHELSSLSVLNISGNVNINELPSHLGLLSRLWNLNTRGCMLQDPLRSMIESKKYKTMDIIGYLKSIYEDAQQYARMKLMVVGVQGIGKTTLLDLLRQGAGSQKMRASENHWAKRMGHTSGLKKSNRGGNISTVGVDIGTWICDKRRKAPGSYGPVVFRTWDFGGQKEYYATHQYFLSKRSLYLVLWKITDGHKGLAEVLQWLGNIQARAPNSPVIIVGTHFDVVGETFSAQKAEELQQIIREKFIAVSDAEKIGLPRVIDSIEVSCRTMHNIRLLANIIYDTAFMLRSPASKESLLLQKVPASYIALEDIVNVIASNFRAAGMDPVLDSESYRRMVTEEMRLHNYKGFRDAAELNQATMFLHDNGVVLHYDDATLRDYYFLDPQWLCDMLAHVVTVREINPFARTGIMKLDDLNLLFRNASTTSSTNCCSYIVSLLNKFEVALTWDSRTLLIPSLLPANESLLGSQGTIIKLCERTRLRKLHLGYSNSYSIKLSSLSFEAVPLNTSENEAFGQALRRILLMTYFPSGFWSRLITRILADEQLTEATKNVYIPSNDQSVDFDLCKALEQETQWNLWQTGFALYFGDVLIFKVCETPFSVNATNQPFRKSTNRFKLKLDGTWNDVPLNTSNILEIFMPLIPVNVSQKIDDKEPQLLTQLKPHMPIIAKLLALTVDHIDLLLEDWYPSLGTRFVHTSEGRFLITRLVLCPKCLQKLVSNNNNGAKDAGNDAPPAAAHVMGAICCSKSRSTGRRSGLLEDSPLNIFSAYLNATRRERRDERRSEDSLCLSDADSGVGPDSAGSSRNTSVDSHPKYHLPDTSNVCYMWMIEECILSVYNQTKISCPLHLEMNILKLAPDVVFADLPEKYSIAAENIVRGSLLGRGAFGFVFKATCKLKGLRAYKPVAMKMLQPVPPGHRAKDSALMAYKIALGKWDRDPLQHACKAYCTARQELAVLLTLKHPNIVPLVGVCIRPLALVLECAPMGALDVILRQYRRGGAHMGTHTFQMLVLQAARAIEYLHRRRIIYRDLKSENVLVWEFPPPHTVDTPLNSVHIKLADYGISRATAPSGAKGFGGTEGFMAPEIIRYNGEEEYTEKVDCFSFGMFIYENISLRQPFEGHESIKECILEGSRPMLTQREAQFPTYCIDLMVLCWDDTPRKRPTASQIVSILSAPECIHLLDVVALPHSEKVICGAVSNAMLDEDGSAGFELWLPTFNSRIDILEATQFGNFLQCSSILCENSLEQPAHASRRDALKSSRSRSSSRANKVSMLCCCAIEENIWMGDSIGNLHAYNASNSSLLFSYMLDPSIKSPVVALIYLRDIQRVAVGLHNGRVFLLDSTKVPSKCAFAEGSFVLTEICSGLILHSACTALVDDTHELWCGEVAGKINIFPLSRAGVCGHQSVCHSEEPTVIEDVKVARMCSNGQYIFSCLFPGFMVYQWNASSKTIENKLDCSKLLPCSESLKSIAIDEHLSLIKCQISALAVDGSKLYIGTTWGCLIIAEVNSLRPITVFRPYENELKAIIPIPNQSMPLIATIGRRYRSLIARYMDIEDNPIAHATVATPTRLEHLNKGRRTLPADVDNRIHCMLWRAEHWT